MLEFYRLLRKETYDFVFDTQGLLKTGVVIGLARVASGGKRIGLANATEGSGYEAASRIFHTISVPVDHRTHAVLRGRLVAAAVLGYTVDKPADFNLREPEQPLPVWLPNEPYAVFFHATARPAKQWATTNWVQIARGLATRGLPVLLAWGNEAERRAAQQLAENMPNARVLPKLSMLEAVMLAQRATLAIGVDTGLTHIAAAYNRPTIELYCDSPRWKTEGNWSQNIVNLGDVGTPPSVEEVQEAIIKLLERQTTLE
jgi:heptosyltransferase I